MAVTQYIGARYVPVLADTLEWSSANAYEPLTIVTYQGDSYTSRQAVPMGVAITNEAFWACTGNYNSQIEAYRQEVARIADQLSTIETTAGTAASDAQSALAKIGTGFDSTNTVRAAVDAINTLIGTLPAGTVDIGSALSGIADTFETVQRDITGINTTIGTLPAGTTDIGTALETIDTAIDEISDNLVGIPSGTTVKGYVDAHKGINDVNGQNTQIYVMCSSGDDANDGLSYDSPVKTVVRALEIAQTNNLRYFTIRLSESGLYSVNDSVRISNACVHLSCHSDDIEAEVSFNQYVYLYNAYLSLVGPTTSNRMKITFNATYHHDCGAVYIRYTELSFSDANTHYVDFYSNVGTININSSSLEIRNSNSEFNNLTLNLNVNTQAMFIRASTILFEGTLTINQAMDRTGSVLRAKGSTIHMESTIANETQHATTGALWYLEECLLLCGSAVASSTIAYASLEGGNRSLVYHGTANLDVTPS